MITVKDNVFTINTPNTSYIFTVNSFGYLQQLYYGSKINEEDISFLMDKPTPSLGTNIVIEKGKTKFLPHNACLECSSIGRGDYRENLVVISDQNDDQVLDLIYKSYQFVDNHCLPDLPQSFAKEQTLSVTLEDDKKGVVVTLFYSTHPNSDVITKSIQITNKSDNTLHLLRVMSNQFDLPEDDYILDTLDGTWARERMLNSTTVPVGVTKIDSKRGISSNAHNPFITVRKKDCSLQSGNAYGFNLIYSGNHAEIVERTVFGKIRVLNGLNDSGFCWHLEPNQSFYSPEATLCFSENGTNGISKEYHQFVNNYIIPKQWQYVERPILINNWEATYFNFTEKKLLDIAKKAQNLGVELFVLDDGWFGKRTNDTKGLGDWTVNKNRLPNGIKGLAEKINKIGLRFGVWVEPEMVNPNSDLYRAHPDWAIHHPNYTPLQCRNQLLLDLANDEVCNYIVEAMSQVFSSANISYVKWDYNRPMTDWYSPTITHQGEFFHRYTLGFYKILKTLTEKFPNILFEACASGGNRFDLGVLCYMPQIWCSDNTDSFDRVKIHEGTLRAYPQSCIGSHVSASPNHQTLRNSTIDNRFNTACIGAFGYELDLSILSKIGTSAVKHQIEWYKKHRKTLQFGQYYQLQSVFAHNKASWVIVNQDQTQAVANVTNTIAQTVPNQDILRIPYFDKDTRYQIVTRQQLFNIKSFGGLINHVSPVHLNEEGKLVEMIDNNFPLKSEVEDYTLLGNTLAKAGIKLQQQWSSCGYDGDTRVMLDFGSRLYSINKV